VKITTQ